MTAEGFPRPAGREASGETGAGAATPEKPWLDRLSLVASCSVQGQPKPWRDNRLPPPLYPTQALIRKGLCWGQECGLGEYLEGRPGLISDKQGCVKRPRTCWPVAEEASSVSFSSLCCGLSWWEEQWSPEAGTPEPRGKQGEGLVSSAS